MSFADGSDNFFDKRSIGSTATSHHVSPFIDDAFDIGGKLALAFVRK